MLLPCPARVRDSAQCGQSHLQQQISIKCLSKQTTTSASVYPKHGLHVGMRAIPSIGIHNGALSCRLEHLGDCMRNTRDHDGAIQRYIHSQLQGNTSYQSISISLPGHVWCS